MLSVLGRRGPTTLRRLPQQARSSCLLHCPAVPRTPPPTHPASRVRQLCSEPTPPPKGFGKFYKHKPGAAAEAETAGKDGAGKASASGAGRAAEASEGAREGAKGESWEKHVRQWERDLEWMDRVQAMMDELIDVFKNMFHKRVHMLKRMLHVLLEGMHQGDQLHHVDTTRRALHPLDA